MEEMNMAANTDVNAPDGLATQTETQVSTPVGADGQDINQDVTQTQAFARRLKEETAKAAQSARDSWIAEQGYEYNGKPITTEAEYKQALKEAEIENSIRKKYETLPDEVLNELVETKKFREQYESEKRAHEEESARIKSDQELRNRTNTMYAEFLEEFKDYGTEDKWKTIPAEVFAEADKWVKSGGREGRRLADAFARHNYSKWQEQQQTSQANNINASSSTGSAKGQGLPDSGFISREVYEQNKSNQTWMSKNYDNLVKSMRKWGK